MSDVTSSVFVRMCVWVFRIYCSRWKHNPAIWWRSPQSAASVLAGSFTFMLWIWVQTVLVWTVPGAAAFDPHFNVGHLQDDIKCMLFAFVCSWRRWGARSCPKRGRLWWVWFNELWIQSPRQLFILVMSTGQRGGHIHEVSYGAHLCAHEAWIAFHKLQLYNYRSPLRDGFIINNHYHCKH